MNRTNVSFLLLINHKFAVSDDVSLGFISNEYVSFSSHSSIYIHILCFVIFDRKIVVSISFYCIFCMYQYYGIVCKTFSEHPGFDIIISHNKFHKSIFCFHWNARRGIQNQPNNLQPNKYNSFAILHLKTNININSKYHSIYIVDSTIKMSL